MKFALIHRTIFYLPLFLVKVLRTHEKRGNEKTFALYFLKIFSFHFRQKNFLNSSSHDEEMIDLSEQKKIHKLLHAYSINLKHSSECVNSILNHSSFS